MKIGISSKSLSQIQMSTIAYWKIRARLLGVPGVANVPIWGEQLQQLQVQTDPEKLAGKQRLARAGHDRDRRRARRRLAAVLRGRVHRHAAVRSRRPTSGSTSSTSSRSRRRRTSPRCRSSGATAADGTPLALGDVADVKIDHQPLVGDAVINGGPGLMLIVEKLPWANTLDVTRGVEDGDRAT